MAENSVDKGAVLITGATGGVGSALAELLHSQGFPLFLAGRNAEKLQALGQRLNAPYWVGDLTESLAAQTVVEKCLEHHGQLSGVAHCVGSFVLKPAHLTSDEDWDNTIAINLTSAFRLVRASVKAMKGSGSIALVSSVAARFGLANHEAIGAAKAGIIGLTLSAAATYAARGIRVNCVAPGLVQTPLTQGLTANETSRKISTAMHPVGRLGEPGDVARVLALLLDPQNSWLTGQVIGVDGGMGSLRSTHKV
ncbi:MAG: SDR family NAD(P)-dependent oxidoreductase [Zavarzinella sp.]